MSQFETANSEDSKTSYEREMVALLQDQILFAESVFVHLPIGIEIYDVEGILRNINEHAKKMYGVEEIL